MTDSLFEQFDNSEKQNMTQLLEKAEKYAKYGKFYCRHIAAPYHRLKNAIAKGHSGKMLDWLADELELRLNYWQEKVENSVNN